MLGKQFGSIKITFKITLQFTVYKGLSSEVRLFTLILIRTCTFENYAKETAGRRRETFRAYMCIAKADIIGHLLIYVWNRT
jgi:hypothetical protein